jgi:hypothetical protein
MPRVTQLDMDYKIGTQISLVLKPMLSFSTTVCFRPEKTITMLETHIMEKQAGMLCSRKQLTQCHSVFLMVKLIS